MTGGSDAGGSGDPDPRLAAHRILRDVDGGAYAHRSAERRLAGLGGRDRRLAQELAYGCIRLRARLDHELEAHVDRPLDRVEPPVRDWLRMGLYQLRELRVPAHAAVDETVEGVRHTVGERATGFVNAVLRSAVRLEDREALFPSPGDDPVGHLTTYGSHPEWLVRRWLDRWSLEEVARLVELDNTPPPVTVRLLDEDPARAAAALAGSGLRLEPLPEWPGCAVLESGEPGALLERIAAVVQDPAASAVVDYVGPLPEGPRVDLCAAPGGKAVALSRLSTAPGPFVAADVQLDRLLRTVEAASRTGAALSFVVMDGRRPALRRARAVVVDAPCTGTGTLRRRPDARWRASPGRLASLVDLQRELLDAAAGLVEEGGLLAYATCSLEEEENERQVEAFLTRHPDFRREAPSADAGLPRDVVDGEGTLRVLPWRRATDGSFAVRLRRRAA